MEENMMDPRVSPRSRHVFRRIVLAEGIVAAQKKKKVLKQGVLRKKDLKKLTLYIKNGANCPCSQLDSLGSHFLIMGRKVDQQLLLMSIHKWDKKSKELKFAIKYMKSHQCPTYHTVFQ
ncbi:hypothetical protein NHX12_022283 [Muraenolepis orangiensis]|uniref:NTR domain-containing protein n=1 Tax=Muraenolepis orangiensis TaxID=630683 RepID=A0A9Q0EMY2_9TELE|nr:hypothetical protein NHX12_022283 [Muraenolepis orangiensis]